MSRGKQRKAQKFSLPANFFCRAASEKPDILFLADDFDLLPQLTVKQFNL
jgi:hypothetical protein